MALTSWGGQAAPQAAQSYINVYNPGVTDAKTGATSPGSWSQQAVIAPPVNPNAGTEWAQMAARAAQQQPNYAVSASPGVGPAFAGAGGGSGGSSQTNLSNYLSSGSSSVPAPPTLQTAQAPNMANYASSGGQSNSQYGPQIQAILAQLQQQANQSDSALQDRVNQQIAAQRAVLERRASQDVTKSLAQNGLLAAGGQAARMRQQIYAPVEEQLAANQSQLNQTLSSERANTRNNMLQQLGSLQSSADAQALNQQQLQMQQQQNAFNQAMAQYNAQVQANQLQYQRETDAYNRQIQQQDRQEAQRQQSAYQQALNGYYQGSGGGGGTSYGPGINASSNSFLEQGTQPRDLYSRGVAADRANQQRQYDTAMAERQNRINSGLAGNGVSSAGSYTGISMNGPLVGSGVGNSGYSYSPPSGYSSSMYQAGGAGGAGDDFFGNWIGS